MQELIDSGNVIAWLNVQIEKARRGDLPIDAIAYYGYALGIVKNLPTVKAEPVRHGRWIVHTTWNGMFGLIHSECSECKFDRNGDLSSWKFCPNCGADMQEVSEDAGTD